MRRHDDTATARHKRKQHLITNENMSKPMQTFTEQDHPKFYNPTHSYYAQENCPGFWSSISYQAHVIKLIYYTHLKHRYIKLRVFLYLWCTHTQLQVLMHPYTRKIENLRL